MHRSRAFNSPPAASHLPPFDAAGWLVTVLNESDQQRHARYGSGEVIAQPPCDSVVPDLPVEKVRQWTLPFTPAPRLLRRVFNLRLGRV